MRMSNDIAEQAIGSLLNQGMTIRQISKKLNRSYTNIKYWTEKLNLDRNYDRAPMIVPDKGTIIGKWEYLGEEINKPRKNSKYTSKYLKCRCICGHIRLVALSSLSKENKIKSMGCGCYFDGKQWTRKWLSIGDISGSYMSSIRSGAKLRKIEFDISTEYAWQKFLDQDRRCAISGIELHFSTTRLKDIDGNKRYFKNQTASLDRIDSSKGYVHGNIQWLHKDINIMKKDFSTKEFLSYIKIIYEYNKDLNIL